MEINSKNIKNISIDKLYDYILPFLEQQISKYKKLSITDEEKDGGSALSDEYTPGRWEGIWDNMNASEQ